MGDDKLVFRTNNKTIPAWHLYCTRKLAGLCTLKCCSCSNALSFHMLLFRSFLVLPTCWRSQLVRLCSFWTHFRNRKTVRSSLESLDRFEANPETTAFKFSICILCNHLIHLSDIQFFRIFIQTVQSRDQSTIVNKTPCSCFCKSGFLNLSSSHMFDISSVIVSVQKGRVLINAKLKCIVKFTSSSFSSHWNQI